MEIQELYLKHFGKFEDRQFCLNDGIQIFYGENEFGKTTIYQFIKAMLFGMEPGRGRGVKTSEYKRYEPWENPNYYAGAMRFTSGGRHFYLERNFDAYQKNARLICEDDGEELSVEAGDLEALLDDVTKATFENTAAIGQMKIAPGKNLAESLEDYAANYSAAQAENLRLNDALLRLKEERKHATKELTREESARREKRRQIRMQQEYVERQRTGKQEKAQEESARLRRLDLEQRAQEELYQKKQAESQKASIVLPSLCLLGMILSVTNLLSLRIPGMVLAVSAGMIGLALWLRRKKVDQDSYSEEEYESRQRQEPDYEEQRKRLRWKIEEHRQEYQELSRELDNLQEAEEELLECTEAELDCMRRIRALDLASERMQQIARETARDFRTEFQKDASGILKELTDGAYQTLRLEENGTLTLYDGIRNLSLYQVSEGTAQQTYFAFRMAAANVLLPEDFPILLDEAFACYDDYRLKSALKWLRKQERQVIIFSCQKREREVLDTL